MKGVTGVHPISTLPERVRVTVVGGGAIGELTATVLAELHGVTVTRLGSRGLTGEALADTDPQLVAVCSPHGLHVDHGLRALAAGAHLVVEKPLALDVGSGRSLLSAARVAERSVSVISQRRFEPAMIAARAAIHSGALGRPLLGDCRLPWHRDADYFTGSSWRGTSDLDGGVLFNQGIHLIDLLRWLLGPVDRVGCRMATLRQPIEAPDTATAWLEFGSGALGSLSATVAAATGAPAELELRFERGTIRFADDRVAEWVVPGYPEPTGTETVGSGSADPKDIGSIGHRRQWEAILSALRAGRQPEVSGSDALGTTALVRALHDSAAAGGAPIRPAAR